MALRLEVLRKQRGLSVASLAFLAGCPTTRMVDYSKGRRRPSHGRLARMAFVLGYGDGPASDLLQPVDEEAR
jgi:transcriptional regulator with XRE-family HTH domain